MFFGTGYYAPVALNVILTTVIAFVGRRIAVDQSIVTPPNGAFFFVFLILHPDITAWSTLVNAKDILVLTLHIFLLHSISLASGKQYKKALIFSGPTIFILIFLRFYVPVLFVVALIPILIFHRKGISLWRLIVVSLATLMFFISGVGASALNDAMDGIRSDFVNPAVGLVRFVLTPIPFNAEPSFEFLNIPSLVHWVLMPALLGGAIKVATIPTAFSRFFILYFVTFVSLYSVYGELQGPRHRIQLDYAIALFQFVGILMLANTIKQKRDIFSNSAASSRSIGSQ